MLELLPKALAGGSDFIVLLLFERQIYNFLNQRKKIYFQLIGFIIFASLFDKATHNA